MSAPDDRDIDDISADEKCDSCGWSPAAVILVDGEWECYNCGQDPDGDSELVTDGGREQDDAAVFRCTNCGEEWVDPFTAIIGHSECVSDGEESARVVRVEDEQ